MITLHHTAALLVLILVGSMAVPATAQQPTRVNPTESAVSEDKLLGEAQRIQGRISIPDRRAANLEQPAGRDWEAWRETTLPRIGAGVILGMVVLLIAFLAIRGRIKVDGGLAGETIQRFSGVERFGHWLTATSFVFLALTGLNVTFGRAYVLPLVGHVQFSEIAQWAKYLHNYMSFAFVLGLVMVFLQWVLFNLPSLRDFSWIAQGGGIIGHKHPPAAKFNAGQKVVFWITIVGGALMAMSGYALMFPFFQLPAGVAGNLGAYTSTIDGIQTVSMIHGAIAMLMIALILAHIYIGTIGMQGAFWSMGSGKVDVNWARQHHSVWADRVLGKSQVQPKAGPAE